MGLASHGGTQTKEDIVIGQGGNSDGATNEATQKTGWSTRDIMSVIVLVYFTVDQVVIVL